jgi:hypothetical protein
MQEACIGQSGEVTWVEIAPELSFSPMRREVVGNRPNVRLKSFKIHVRLHRRQ